VGELLRRVDDQIYRVERWIVVFSSIVMAIVVFFDVVYRRYTAIESKMVEKVASWTGMDAEGSTVASLHDNASWMTWLLTVGLVYFGVRSASRRPLIQRVERPNVHVPIEVPKALGLTAAIVVGIWLVLRIVFGSGNPEDIIQCGDAYSWSCGIYPYGMPWSQPLALIFTLWLGFLGASMATHDHRHLKVEALQRYLPETAQRAAGLLSALAAAAFCLFLAYISYRYVGFSHQDYVDSDGLGGLHDGVDFPRYRSFAVVPVAYALMSARFVTTGILAWNGELDTTPAELADLDLDLEPGPVPESRRVTLADAGSSKPAGAAPSESEVETLHGKSAPLAGGDAVGEGESDEKGGAR
jgi:TRAP-type C4-dicarboxylate transport system permease small subunit